MTLTEQQRFNAATRLINAATGEPYGDGETITDIGEGYANNGNGWHSDIWVLGNWNGDMGKRLFTALERIGVNAEWLDEWNRCDDCQKLIRTEPTCYSWMPQYEIVECEYVCRDCLIDQLPFSLEHYVNNSNRAVTWLDKYQLDEHGWIDAYPSEYDAANGFGQDDRPADMVTRLRESGDDRDYLFVITEKGQFDMKFRLLVREETEDE